MMFCPDEECKMYMKPMGGCCEFCGYDLVKHFKDKKEQPNQQEQEVQDE